MRLPSVRSLITCACFVALLLPGTAFGQMTEVERKAAARAAYSEGVELQDQGKTPEALARFEAAQKLFDAPTHLVRIAECQAMLGRLVEASETYETLTRRQLPAGSPEPFVQAQQQAHTALPALRQRIPTLRVTLKPDTAKLQNLQVTVNGAVMPVELVGIARPLNPGAYRLAASASGYVAPAQDVEVHERDAKNVELTLQPQLAPSPAPPPYAVEPDLPVEKPHPPAGASSTGLLVGARGGAFVPGGSIQKNVNFDTVASAGGGFTIDGLARLGRVFLLGGTFEYASLGKPDSFERQIASGVSANSSTSTIYLGLVAGIVPNIDRVSFVGDFGLGFRGLKRDLTLNGLAGAQQTVNESASGLEFGLGAGVMIPAGPIRIVPKAALNFGSFGQRTTDCEKATTFLGCTAATSGGSISDTAVHTVFFVGLGLYYHADLGKK